MCTREITAFKNPDGGRPIFGWEGVKKGLQELKLPCGKCPECCKDYYTAWATRGSRELALWETSLFITLTYSDEKLPKNASLRKKDVQNFIKRVKKYFRSCSLNPVRQIYCGEYGTKTQRPHYHVVLFNADFFNKKRHRTTEQGHQVYTSPALDFLWGRGHAEFGYAEPSSIAYLFKYILKKKSRKEKLQPLIINGNEVEHEFIEASRNPGIGAHVRHSDSIKKGFLTLDGVKKKLPKYYSEHQKKYDPRTFEKNADRKFDYMIKLPKESTLRKIQKEETQKKLTDTKKRL